MRTLITIYIILLIIIYSCSLKDYVQIEPMHVKLIKKELINDNIAQYWLGDRITYLQMLPKGDTGYAVGTTVTVFKTK
jgi:hypothetical protein